jgi:xanthine/uracil permease
LKSGAVVFAAIGGSMAAWGLDKWVHQPQARASQFGFEAPLWPAFTLFVVVATIVGVGLLWSAAGRVEAGEDLFAQRHRRHPSETPDEAERP